jgi:dephospho-CoA kinase
MHVGLTGGIGSGKTTVSEILKSLSVPVFNADDAGKLAYQDPAIKEQIFSLWGDAVFDSERINFKALASLVFTNDAELKKLEAIIHPWVHEKWLSFFEIHRQKPYCVRETALLFSSKSAGTCDKIIAVDAPIELRIRRVQKRNGLSREEILLRMKKQMDATEINRLSDFVIINDEVSSLLDQTYHIHEQLILLNK